MDMRDLRTLVFDVMGTVVDEDTTTHDEVHQLFVAHGLAPARLGEFTSRWSELLGAAMHAVQDGGPNWRANDELRAEALRQTVTEFGWADELPTDAVDLLAGVGHRFAPYADSPAALEALGRSHALVALSNASPPQLVDISVAGGLRWHLALSADAERGFKPSEKLYRLPAELLGCSPSELVFVAAHPWDLRGAAALGYRTVLVRRPGVEDDGTEFDLVVSDLTELAAELG